MKYGTLLNYLVDGKWVLKQKYFDEHMKEQKVQKTVSC